MIQPFSVIEKNLLKNKVFKVKLLFYFYLLILFIFVVNNLCFKYRYNDSLWGSYEYGMMQEIVER